MKRLAAILVFSALGCQAPTPTPFAGDVYLPAHGAVGVRESAVTTGDGPNGAHIIFLNFDGATVKPPSGWNDNSATNSSQIANGTATLPAFDASPYAPSFTRQTAIN